jgi:hypothetical protein
MVDCTNVELEATVATPDDSGDEMPNRQTEYVIDDEATPESFSEATDTESSDDDSMITGPKFSEQEPVAKPQPMPEIELETPASAVTPATKAEAVATEDDDVVDLYALGAVDYEPENIHHNA